MATTKELIKGIKGCEDIFRNWIKDEGLVINGEVDVHIAENNRRAGYFASVYKNVPLQRLYFNCRANMSLYSKNNRLRDFKVEFCSDGSMESEDLFEEYCKELEIFMNK